MLLGRWKRRQKRRQKRRRNRRKRRKRRGRGEGREGREGRVEPRATMLMISLTTQAAKSTSHVGCCAYKHALGRADVGTASFQKFNLENGPSTWEI